MVGSLNIGITVANKGKGEKELFIDEKALSWFIVTYMVQEANDATEGAKLITKFRTDSMKIDINTLKWEKPKVALHNWATNRIQMSRTFVEINRTSRNWQRLGFKQPTIAS